MGLTLYELMVLRPAFDSPDRVALSEQIKAVEPPRPRAIDPRIPRDLETIVLKAIEKDPGDRYATAEAMAADLRRFLEDQPILARRVGVHERYARWARRNPVIATLGAALTVVLIAATIASVLAVGRMAALVKLSENAARSEHDAGLAALAAQERAEQHLYDARIGQAEGSLRLSDYRTAHGLLALYLPGPGQPDRRGWEWFYLHQWCRPELRTLHTPNDAETQAVAVSPDGRLLAVGCSGHGRPHPHGGPDVPAYLIGLPDGGIRHKLDGHEESVLTVAFRPDGKHLATLGAEGTIRLWDIATGRSLGVVDLARRIRVTEKGTSSRLHWSPDGRRLAIAADERIQIWDPETGRETARIDHPTTTLAWGPDGARIASADAGSPVVRLWDARHGRSCGPALELSGPASSIAWSPDGRWIAAGSVDNEGGAGRHELSLWDATTGQRSLRMRQFGALQSVVFSPDGARLATGGEEGIVRVFDVATGRERAALFAEFWCITGLAYGPDGRRLYTPARAWAGSRSSTRIVNPAAGASRTGSDSSGP